jgi:23S rRNA G2445 N2-methylase RlmL
MPARTERTDRRVASAGSAGPLSGRLYLATTLGGLEGVLAAEARASLPAVSVAETTRGKVYLATPDPPQTLFGLRTADNLYRLLGRFRVGPHRGDLAAVRAAVAALDLSPDRWGAVTATELPGTPETPERALRARESPTFFVNASRRGRHTYSRFDLAAAATAGILDRRPAWRAGDPVAHQLELRLDVDGEEAVLSLRLTPPSFRFRGAREFSPAALRPTVAHALVWLSRPAPGDRFLDPFCGSGTVLAERLPYPAQRIAGGDASLAAVGVAQANLASSRDARVFLAQWDARRLPIGAAAVDTVVTNLPFGRQVLTPPALAALYEDFAAELGRVLTGSGRAILLTEHGELLRRAAAGVDLAAETLMTLSLKGLQPQVLRLTR